LASLTIAKLCGARIMADSDNTTTLPFVTRRDAVAGPILEKRVGQLVAPDIGYVPDPAAILARDWLDANAKTQALCIKQQKLESVLNNGIANCRGDYTAALRAENRAAKAEQALLDRLPGTPAGTMEGIVGKLTMILGECEDNSDATDFPGLHIRSVLDDLRRVAGQGLAGDKGQAERSKA
jgi:hypothetical protein